MDRGSSRYGDEVERYLDVFLRTPGLPQDAVARALVARGKARKEAGQRLLVKSEQGKIHIQLVCLLVCLETMRKQTSIIPSLFSHAKVHIIPESFQYGALDEPPINLVILTHSLNCVLK